MKHLTTYKLFESLVDDIEPEIQDILANLSDEGFNILVLQEVNTYDEIYKRKGESPRKSLDIQYLEIVITKTPYKDFTYDDIKSDINDLISHLKGRFILKSGRVQMNQQDQHIIIKDGQVVSISLSTRKDFMSKEKEDMWNFLNPPTSMNINQVHLMFNGIKFI